MYIVSLLIAKKASRIAAILAALVFLAPLVSAAEVAVFAAASLSDALKEIAPLYAKATGDTLRFNFGASGTLARQIKEGAPADVIFSADELRVDELEKAGLLATGTRARLLANTLAVVVSSDSPVSVKTLDDLAKTDIRRIAIGDPVTVPVGTYTKEYLQKIGDWSKLAGKMIPLDTVRSALAAVESGNAEAGFVYTTDALISKKVKIVIEVLPGEGPKITYPAAVLKDAKQAEAGRAFIQYLAESEAQRIFIKYGFLPAK